MKRAGGVIAWNLVVLHGLALVLGLFGLLVAIPHPELFAGNAQALTFYTEALNNTGGTGMILGTLIDEDHDFQTVYLDSLDWLEPLVHAHVCAANNWANIEAPGYGKGYIQASEEWRTLLNGLDALRNQRNMGVVLIAHDKVKRVEDPLTEGYDSHVLTLHDRASALVSEWADVIGYAGYRVFVTKTDAGFGQKESKAATTGERLLHVEAHPAHCGGTRFGLTNMPLDWAAFSAALAAVQTQ